MIPSLSFSLLDKSLSHTLAIAICRHLRPSLDAICNITINNCVFDQAIQMDLLRICHSGVDLYCVSNRKTLREKARFW